MISASSKIADRIARLRGGGAPDEKRFHYRVERIEGGGGKAKTENE